MTVLEQLKRARAELTSAILAYEQEQSPAPASLKGVCAGYWGPQELEDLKNLQPQAVRLGTPSSTRPWSAYKIVFLQEGDTNGSYNAGGVQAINVPAFVEQMGRVVAGNPEIWALELLNEPGGSWFWGGNAMTAGNAGAYARLVRAVWEARRSWSVKPLLLVSVDGGHRACQWYEWMLAADPKIGECFDMGTCHPYGGTGERAASALGDRQTVERVRVLTGKPVAVTEVGWPTEAQTGDSLQWTEAQQAQNITSFLAWAKAQGFVALTTIYNYRGGSPGYGLARQDDTRKPAWAAFTAA